MVKPSWEGLPDMWKAAFDLVAQVPMGRVTTYGAVARSLGDLVASRFVGLAMGMNDDIVRVPCHRVVQSDGHIGGYTCGGPRKKARLLREEGIDMSGDKVVGMDRFFFENFRSDCPLRMLRNRQTAMKRRLMVSSKEKIHPERVAGVDVAYEGDHAFAAMVVFDMESGKEIARFIDEADARFPYIPTYLAFREVPVIRGLIRNMDAFTVLMYDGNGVLHPHGFGIASQVGVEFGVPTIGVAKTLLCGSPAGRRQGKVREIRIAGRVAGYVLKSTVADKGVYVSAGHRISPECALDIAGRFLQHRVPEPTRMAHIAAEEARRGTRNK